jgi:hypothetical protein
LTKSARILRLLNEAPCSKVSPAMKPLCKLGLGVLLVGAAAISRAAETPAFDRYQVIIDRKPFGDPPPPPPEPAKPPPPKADSFAKSLRLSMIMESDDGEINVGIVDTSNNLSFILRVGEPDGEYELVSASFDDGEAVLRRGEEMALLDITKASFQEVTPGQPRAQPGVSNPADSRPTYAERRRMRAEQLRQQAAQPPPEPKYTGEALEKHLHDYQMEVIRQGLPPLPIPLTPEQDDQLVAEGYLPAVN